MKITRCTMTPKEETSIIEGDLKTAIVKVLTFFQNNNPIVEIKTSSNFLSMTAAPYKSCLSFKNDGSYDFTTLWRFVAELTRWMETSTTDNVTHFVRFKKFNLNHAKLSLYTAFSLEREWSRMFAQSHDVAAIYDKLRHIAEERGLAPKVEKKEEKVSSKCADTTLVDNAWDAAAERAAKLKEAQIAAETEQEWAAIHAAANEADVEAAVTFDSILPTAPTATKTIRSTPPTAYEISSIDANWEDPPVLVTKQKFDSNPPNSTDVDDSWGGDRPSQAA
jgi:hypothetical protein